MNKMFIISASILLFLVFVFVGNYSIQQMHSGGFYRTQEIYENLGPVLYYEEGLYATVTVRDLISPFGRGKALFINGKGQGSTEIADLRVNYLLAYLPKLIRSETENSLVIGLGTGTTSGQLSQVSETTTIEIEPEVLGASKHFRNFNLDVLNNENHKLIIDDGRNYLLRNDGKYDVIIPEPSDPWQSFSTNLFSREFFELAKEDLGENGLYLQWVPIYQMSPEDFKSFYKTFNSVFPNVVAFANIKLSEDTPVKFSTSEIILVGSENEININEEMFNGNYNSLPKISKQGLGTLRLSSGSDIYNLKLFDSRDLEGYAEKAKVITDDNLLLEFSSAKNVYNQNPEEVIADINDFLEKNE